MSSNGKIVGLIVVLAIIFAFIGALVSYDLQQYNLKQTQKVIGKSDTLVELESSSESKNTNVLVNDRFTGKLEADSNVVAIGEDGSMYIVKKGTVLVSDMVVQNSEETILVYRINDPEKSVSSK